jgi:hypothetical protein
LQRPPQSPTEQLFQFRDIGGKIFLEFRAKRLSQRPPARDPVETPQRTHGVETKRICRVPQRQECRRWLT